MEARFETFTLLINSISRSIKRIKTSEIEGYDLKGSHVSVLYYLYREGELTSKDLCERCEADKAHISRVVEYLETEDFICCEKNEGKRYRSQFSLTEKGKMVGEYISNKVDATLNLTAAGLTEDELQTMYKCLLLINENLKGIHIGGVI